MSGGTGGSTPSRCPTTDTLPTDPAALRVYQRVEARQHAAMQSLWGQYACGDSPLYRGTFSAMDNYAPAFRRGGMHASGPVIASLETTTGTDLDFLTCDQTVMGVRALTVISRTEKQAVRVFQVLGAAGSKTARRFLS